MEDIPFFMLMYIYIIDISILTVFGNMSCRSLIIHVELVLCNYNKYIVILFVRNAIKKIFIIKY